MHTSIQVYASTLVLVRMIVYVFVPVRNCIASTVSGDTKREGMRE